MTSLRKYLPCDHEDQFHVDRFDAFLTFIEALNAPVPDKALGAGSFSLSLLTQSLLQRRDQNLPRTIAVSTMGDGT